MLTGWTRVVEGDRWWGDRTARWAFWLSVAIAIGCAIPALFQAFSSPYVVQDDARQHVFWMRRWLNPDLFQNDLIADYFQSVDPWGYTGLYRLGAWLAIDPMVLNKCLPIGLGIISTIYCFRLVWQLLPVPLAGLSACIFLNQNLWIADDLVSGVPVAFIYPLFLAFLDAWLRRSLWGTAGAIVLLAGFYPHGVLLGASVVGLSAIGRLITDITNADIPDLDLPRSNHSGLLNQDPSDAYCSVEKTGENRSFWEISWSLQQKFDHQFPVIRVISKYRFELIIMIISIVSLLPLLGKSATYGPVLTAAEAKTLWAQFFDVQPAWAYWFKHRRTGLIPIDWWEIDFAFPQIALSALLPVLWGWRDRFALSKATRSNLIVLLQLLVVSLVWFTTAHLVLFRFHLPNRYAEHSLRIIVAIAGAISLTWLMQSLWHWASINTAQTTLKKSAIGLFCIGLLVYPFTFTGFPMTQYEIGAYPNLYRFFQQQPTTIKIASTTRETDNLPSFSQRSIVVGPGFTMRYHRRYARELLQRATDLLTAQYTTNSQVLSQIIDRYQIDFWLLDRADFNPDHLTKMGWVRWFRASPQESLAIAHTQAIKQLRRGDQPVMLQRLDRCQRFTVDSLIILDAPCLKQP